MGRAADGRVATTVTTGSEATSTEHGPMAEAERIAALAAGAPKVPRRAVVIAVVVAAVLAIGGAALERLFASAGLNPTSSTSGIAPTPDTGPAPALGASMAALLGIVRLRPAPAPPLTLVDQSGTTVTLGQLRGKVVVVTFFDADCSDACPVLAQELAQADGDLGADRAGVVFLTVNTDPLHTATAPLPAAVADTGLVGLGNWHFLTGPLAALDSVWREYGVTINVSTAFGAVVHNNVAYFVDPEGQLRIRATPVADETSTGSFSLPPASIRRTGTGIASYAAGLLTGSQ